jgi:hypothetical protein
MRTTPATDYELVQRMISGDREASREVVTALTPVINRQTARFCQRYCYDQQFVYQCTTCPPLKGAPDTAPLCEWGNASYEWMLTDLTAEQRLKNFEGRNSARFVDYAFVIAQSVPFYERWKDWRFANHVYVPSYIKKLHPAAAAIFRGLRAQRSVADIASQQALSVDQTQTLARQITRLLVEHNRLYLLVPETQVPVDHIGENENEINLAGETVELEGLQQQQLVKAAFEKLDAVEQFVLESFYVDDMSAKKILRAIERIDWHEQGMKTPIEDIQQLYYFRRKALAKLMQHYHNGIH